MSKSQLRKKLWLNEIKELHEVYEICFLNPKLEYPYEKFFLVWEMIRLINKFPKRERQLLLEKYVYSTSVY